MNIEKRILCLEKKSRFQRFGFIVLVGVFGASTLMGTSQDNVPGDATFNEITAKALTFVDKDGKVVMSMGSGEDGPGLVIFDPASTPRIAIGFSLKDKGAGVAFLDEKSNPRIAIGTTVTGDAGITLLGAGISAPLAGKAWPSK